MDNKDHMPKKPSEHLALEDRGWTAMTELLDKHMPVEKKRRVIIWWWLAAAALTGFGIFGLLYQQINPVQIKTAEIVISSPNKDLNEQIIDSEETSTQLEALPSVKAIPIATQNDENAGSISSSPTGISHPTTPTQLNQVNTTSKERVSSNGIRNQFPSAATAPPLEDHETARSQSIKNLITTTSSNVAAPWSSQNVSLLESISFYPEFTKASELKITPSTRMTSEPIAVPRPQSHWSMTINTFGGTGFDQTIGNELVLKPKGLTSVGAGVSLNRQIGSKVEIGAGIGYQKWQYNQLLFSLVNSPELILGAAGADSYFTFNRSQAFPSQNVSQKTITLNHLTLPFHLHYRLLPRLSLQGGLQANVNTQSIAKTAEAASVSVDNTGQPVDKNFGVITNTSTSISYQLYRSTHLAWYLGLGWNVKPIELSLRWYTSGTFLTSDWYKAGDYKHRGLFLNAAYQIPLR